MSQLHRAAMQGLSINMMFSKDPAAMDPMMALLHRYKEMAVDLLIAASSAPNEKMVRTRLGAKRSS
jgi:hypothetical protein